MIFVIIALALSFVASGAVLALGAMRASRKQPSAAEQRVVRAMFAISAAFVLLGSGLAVIGLLA